MSAQPPLEAPLDRSALDVIGLGNALVDVLSHQDDHFLETAQLVKGAMALIDAERAQELYAAMGPGVEISGGSAANTMVGIASFGGRAAFLGRVSDDQLGTVFAHDIRAAGVHFATSPASDGAPTGRCLILVTPDAQRTLNTFLGAASELNPDDVDEHLIGSEGYLFDQGPAKEAFRRAAKLAHQAGRRVALTLSDGFCVDRHRDDFLDLVRGDVDILFANEVEICTLYETDDFDQALVHVRGHCEIAALTRSERGSVIVTADEVLSVPAASVARVLDTTGAGDQYAAGFLYGLTHGYGPGECGRLGSLAAAEVIAHLGARPEVSLAELAAATRQ